MRIVELRVMAVFVVMAVYISSHGRNGTATALIVIRRDAVSREVVSKAVINRVTVRRVTVRREVGTGAAVGGDVISRESM
jgi:hypothetical protein